MNEYRVCEEKRRRWKKSRESQRKDKSNDDGEQPVSFLSQSLEDEGRNGDQRRMEIENGDDDTKKEGKEKKKKEEKGRKEVKEGDGRREKTGFGVDAKEKRDKKRAKRDRR